ncbi:DUF1648 domain-containing protein [Neobacillus dielmonensis]|uniref:DUF1648 domain-containing protein n=1 Tax=Neobacillus dielmonensis TaxID=1347369 RepID=UPI0005A958AB
MTSPKRKAGMSTTNQINEKLQKTLLEKGLDLVSVILILVTFIYIFVYWSSLPNQIPMRFDSDGVVSQWGRKKSIKGLPFYWTNSLGSF